MAAVTVQYSTSSVFYRASTFPFLLIYVYTFKCTTFLHLSCKICIAPLVW